LALALSWPIACLSLASVPPAGQRKRPHTTSTQPMSLPIMMSACAVLLEERYQFSSLTTQAKLIKKLSLKMSGI